MENLFVQGPEKTATSTLTGMLNCHPHIFILFETYLAQAYITKYGQQFLERYPEARKFFRYEEDYGKPVEDIFKYLSKVEPEYSYKYGGTKINGLDPFTTQKVKNHKIIFTKRDVRSWLVKQTIIERYRTDLDVVVPAIEYMKYIVNSSRIQTASHVWLEDLIENSSEVISNLCTYLNLDLKPHLNKWWESFGNFDDNDPKSVYRLNHVHHSSKVKPEKHDTTYELKNSPFWDELDVVFKKYYRVNSYDLLSEEEVQEDLHLTESLKRFSPIPFTEIYQHVESVRLGFKKPREVYFRSKTDKSGNKKSIIKRITQRLQRITEIGFKNYHITK